MIILLFLFLLAANIIQIIITKDLYCKIDELFHKTDELFHNTDMLFNKTNELSNQIETLKQNKPKLFRGRFNVTDNLNGGGLCKKINGTPQGGGYNCSFKFPDNANFTKNPLMTFINVYQLNTNNYAPLIPQNVYITETPIIPKFTGSINTGDSSMYDDVPLWLTNVNCTFHIDEKYLTNVNGYLHLNPSCYGTNSWKPCHSFYFDWVAYGIF